MKPYFTITAITPSYNQGQFIENTILSILSQAGDFYIDYIIIDGGSTDGTIDIIKKYELLLNNGLWPIKCMGISYRWVSEKDKGQADAINKGFRMSRGDIIAWLNSDDTYAPGALDLISNHFNDNSDSTIVYGKGYYIDSEGNTIGQYPTSPFSNDELPIFNFICQPSVFFRRKAFERIGGVDVSLQYVMDYDLWIRMSKNMTFEYLPEFLSNYRIHNDAKTISPYHAIKRQLECLKTVINNYEWAPLNRVFIYTFYRLKSRLPAAANRSPLVMFLSFPVALIHYIILNKGIRLKDKAAFSLKYIKKIIALNAIVSEI